MFFARLISVLLDEIQSHIKNQGLQAISGLKGETVKTIASI